jgi:hypothetical protein
MAFSPYDQVELRGFTPLTREDILMPAMAARERHDQVELALDEQATQLDAIGALLDVNPGDTELRERYDNFSSRLSSEGETLLSRGVTPSSSRGLRDLRSAFTREIAPVGLAAQLRNADKDLYNKMKTNDPTFEGVDPGTRRLKDYIDNNLQSMPVDGISGSAIYKQVGELAKQLSDSDRRLLDDVIASGGIESLLGGQYYNIHEDKGFSPWGVNQSVADLEKGSKLLRDIVGQVMGAHGIDIATGNNTRGLAPVQVANLLNHAKTGLYHAIGKENSQTLNNKAWEMMVGGGGNGGNPSNIPYPQEWQKTDAFADHKSTAFKQYKDNLKKVYISIKKSPGFSYSKIFPGDSYLSHVYLGLNDAGLGHAVSMAMKDIKKQYYQGKDIPEDDEEFLKNNLSIIKTRELVEDPAFWISATSYGNVLSSKLRDEGVSGFGTYVTDGGVTINGTLGKYLNSLSREEAKVFIDNAYKGFLELPYNTNTPLAGKKGKELDIINAKKDLDRMQASAYVSLPGTGSTVLAFEVPTLTEEDMDARTEAQQKKRDEHVALFDRYVKARKEGTVDVDLEKQVRELAAQNPLFNVVGGNLDAYFSQGELISPVGNLKAMQDRYLNREVNTNMYNYRFKGDATPMVQTLYDVTNAIAENKTSFKKVDLASNKSEEIKKDELKKFLGIGKDDGRVKASVQAFIVPGHGLLLTSSAKPGERLLVGDTSFSSSALKSIEDEYLGYLKTLSSPVTARSEDSDEGKRLNSLTNSIISALGDLYYSALMPGRNESTTVPAGMSNIHQYSDAALLKRAEILRETARTHGIR